MGPVYAEIDIDAPREQIFDYLMDISTRPVLFEDSISQFRLLRLESRGIGSGARFQFKRRSKWADTAITAVEEPFRISERGVTGNYNKTKTGTEWEIAESPAGLSSVRLTFWTEPHGLGKGHDRLTGGAGWHTRQLKHAVRRLRDLIEAENTSTDRVATAGGNRHATGVL